MHAFSNKTEMIKKYQRENHWNLISKWRWRIVSWSRRCSITGVCDSQVSWRSRKNRLPWNTLKNQALFSRQALFTAGCILKYFC